MSASLKKSQKSELRKFGFIFALFFLIITAITWIIKTKINLWFIYFSAGFFIIAILAPIILHPLYIVWTKFGAILGKVNSTIILTLIFFLIFTPIALICKILRIDFLKKRFNKKALSYWDKRLIKPTSMLKQF